MPVTNNYIAENLFMTGQEVINLVFTNKNTDTNLISPEVRLISEQAHIIEPLGFSFYVHLKEAFTAGTETADEILLMVWIKSALAQFTKFEVILELQNQSTSSGIVGNIPEFASLVSPADLNVYKQDTYRKGKVMLGQLELFLNKNASFYPEFIKGNGTLCNGNITGAIKTHGMIIY